MLDIKHFCPEWDYAEIAPGDPEMEVCICKPVTNQSPIEATMSGECNVCGNNGCVEDNHVKPIEAMRAKSCSTTKGIEMGNEAFEKTMLSLRLDALELKDDPLDGNDFNPGIYLSPSTNIGHHIWKAAIAHQISQREAYQRGYAAGEAKWQPIETAPKDGTRIIGLTSFGAEVVKYNEIKNCSALQKTWIAGWVGVEQDSECNSAWESWDHIRKEATCQPTHWMPLPPPIKQPQGDS